MSRRFVRLEVRGETISATAGRDGSVVELGDFPNQDEPMRRLLFALGAPNVVKNIPSPNRGELAYVLYWQLDR